MSNRIYFSYLLVEPLNDDGSPRLAQDGSSEKSYGFAVYDSYDERATWGYPTFEELKKKVSLENMIEFLESLTEDSGFAEIAGERGMYFNGEWYTAEELEKLQNHEDGR